MLRTRVIAVGCIALLGALTATARTPVSAFSSLPMVSSLPTLNSLPMFSSLPMLSALPMVSALPIYGVDLQGRPVSNLALSGPTIVLFFLATDCPISNRYLPEIERLRSTFAGRGVSFWQVYPNATETLASIREHQRSFPSTLPVLIDPTQHTSTLTGAGITPEAAILTLDHGSLQPVYLGRIDNRFVSIGVERPHATRHDLEDALVAVLAHRPAPQPTDRPTDRDIPLRRTSAVGCGIVRQP